MLEHDHPPKTGMILLSVLGAVLCLAALPARPPWVLRPPWRTHGATDATAFRIGAELVGTPGLYQTGSVAQLQDRLVGNHDAIRMFIRPPWYALVMRWMTLFSYEKSILIWKLALVVTFLLFVLLWPGNRMHALLAIGWSLPAVAALEQGQDIPVFLLIVALSYVLLRRQAEVAAGLLFSLCSIKFHLLLFLPIAVLVHRRWRFAVGIVAGMACLSAVSFAIQGPGWISDYYSLVAAPENRALTPIVPSIEGLLWPLPLSRVLYGCIVAAVAAYVWRVSLLWPFEIAASASIAAALLVSPHAYIQDAMVLIPLALQVVGFKGPLQRLAIWILSPLSTYPLAWWLPILGPGLLVVPLYKLLTELTVGFEGPQKA